MLDDVFDALADAHRRQLLLDLRKRDPQPVPRLSGVTREIARADERLRHLYLSGSVEIDGVDERRLRLHTVHLPTLDDYGFVEWRRGDRTVSRGPRFDDVRPVLELLDEPLYVRFSEEPLEVVPE